MSPTGKVLVIGDDTRSFLATVRSLGRNRIEVHAAPFDFTSPALKSKYISATHWLPHYINDGREWLSAFRSLLALEKFTLVIPCDERAIIPLVLNREQLEREVCLAIPNASGLDAFFDKARTREIAISLGIPISPGRVITTNDTAARIIEESGLPVAIKPASSYSQESLYSRNKVTIAKNREDVESALRTASKTPHLFESFFRGAGIGLSVLTHEGKIIQAFQHRRVHEIHGASHYRVSENISPSMLEAVERLMRHTEYTGIAMVEFRLNDETGQWVLLEVNARPWGSLPLPVALGLDFPYWWYNLLVQGNEIAGRPYPVGIYGRNLLPDIRYFLSTAKVIRENPAKIVRFSLQSLAEYGRLFIGREVHDVFQLNDPLPGLVELLGALGTKIHAVRRLRVINYALKRLDKSRFRKAMRRNKSERSIVFVCQGNICRSPFASALLERSLNFDPAVSISSFGNLPRISVCSPTNAIGAASHFGIDLSGHRSNALTRKGAEDASVIIAFDEINKRWIRERFPRLQTPVILLGSYLPAAGSRLEISDPDGHDLKYFEDSYQTIANGIKALANELTEIRYE